jgi:hypothetical protein
VTDNYSLGAAQRAIGEVLIPEARASQGALPPAEESLPIALELFYTALAMKPAYQRAGMVVAERYAARMGHDPQQVGAFAQQRVLDTIEQGGE